MTRFEGLVRGSRSDVQRFEGFFSLYYEFTHTYIDKLVTLKFHYVNIVILAYSTLTVAYLGTPRLSFIRLYSSP